MKEERTGNFWPLTMLNAGLKILAKVVANCLQVLLNCLVSPEQTISFDSHDHWESWQRSYPDQFGSVQGLRADHHFLEAVLSVDLPFVYSPSAMVKVNGVRSKPFIMSRYIHQGCPFSPLLYVLALEPFLCWVRGNPVLGAIMLPGANKLASYSTYTDSVSMPVMSSAELKEKSECLRWWQRPSHIVVVFMERFTFPGPLHLDKRPCKILYVWFSPNIQLKKNWLEVCCKGWCVPYMHLPSQPLPSLSSTTPMHHSRWSRESSISSPLGWEKILLLSMPTWKKHLTKPYLEMKGLSYKPFSTQKRLPIIEKEA